ncbi:MAG TPA: hemerythrin domain-containing protein [Candidatus Limnocylindria bacterium]|nr:hemerythrin domain-containing protein [Candidatus Limnocylindria bacterium]
MRITDRFSSEHDVFLEQLEVLESLTSSGASVEALTSAIRTLAKPLLVHAEAEERALFPALEPSMGGDGGPLAILTDEHATLHGQIEELTGQPARVDFERVFTRFRALLRAHIDKEEQVLFPAAAQILGDDRLERLGGSGPRSAGEASARERRAMAV